MDEDIKASENVVTPTGTGDVTSQGTPTTIDTSTTNASAPSQQNATPTTETSGTNRNLQAEIGKVSQLEKERNEFSKKAKQEEEARLNHYIDQFEARETKSLDLKFQNSPEEYEKFRKAYLQKTGQDLGDHSRIYPSQVGSQNINQPAYQVQPTQIPYIDPSKMKEDIKKDLMQEQEDNRISGKVINEIPELLELYQKEPEKALDEYKKLYIAGAALAQVTGMDQADAMVHVSRTMPDKYQENLKKARETGELSAQAKKNNASVGIETPSSGLNSSGGGVEYRSQLTSAEQKVYDDWLRNKSKTLADKFAMQAINNRKK